MTPPRRPGAVHGRAPRQPARQAAEAIAWTALFRVILWALPFRHVLALARCAARPCRVRPAEAPAPDLEVALASVGRFVPRATCLPRGLAAVVILARAGYAPALVLGTPTGRHGDAFTSHAWVEIDDRPVFGEAAAPHQEIARLGFGKRDG